jgi:formimidoylglutamate deiminase
MEALRYFKFDALLQQQGWIKPAFVGVDASGRVQWLSESAPPDAAALEMVKGVVLPGIPNAHSHAFQFAMAGTAEKHVAGSTDDFWSWREAMYECALQMRPDEMEAVAAMAYAEMLRRGYTHVAEFHYLHHDIKGKPYRNLAEMGERLIAAADTAGIKITLIPVFYQKGGFGKGPEERQRRFISSSTDEYFFLLDATLKAVKNSSSARAGFSVHSLRAVDAKSILETFESGPRDLPFHLHAAEQLKEVDDCVSFLGQRPVQWILNNLPVQERFSLVHCTHLSDDEVKQLAQSRANAILCPGTEGNLGDGFFRLKDYASAYGNWALGTDSHISLNPFEDLRWLDYGQRLRSHQRNTFDDAATVFMNKVIPCGRKSLGISTGNFFEEGQPFDAVVVETPALAFEHALPHILYTADSSSLYGTIVDGKWVVKNNVHKSASSIKTSYEKALKRMLSS